MARKLQSALLQSSSDPVNFYPAESVGLDPRETILRPGIGPELQRLRNRILFAAIWIGVWMLAAAHCSALPPATASIGIGTLGLSDLIRTLRQFRTAYFGDDVAVRASISIA